MPIDSAATAHVTLPLQIDLGGNLSPAVLITEIIGPCVGIVSG